MNNLVRFAVLMASLMSLFAALTTTAGAVTWHNSGDTTFTATGGPGTLTVTSATLTCNTGSATGTMAPTNFVGAVWKAAHGNITYSSCAFAGIPHHLECVYDFTFINASGATISGALDLGCSYTQMGSTICGLQGQVTGYYENANQADNTYGRIVTTTSHLRTVAPCISLLGAPGEPIALSTLNLVVKTATGANGMGPAITRTA